MLQAVPRDLQRCPGPQYEGRDSLSLEVQGSIHLEKAFSSNREFENKESKELRMPAVGLNANLSSLAFLGKCSLAASICSGHGIVPRAMEGGKTMQSLTGSILS